MLTEISHVTLRLKGPLQSWGHNSQFNRRNTSLMPTKSAIGGMLCASFGYNRGSEDEAAFLAEFRMCSFVVFDLSPVNSVNCSLQRIGDFHTILNTAKVRGKINTNACLTYRQYITDGFFGVILSGRNSLMEEVTRALKDPIWGIWLGRKSCIPSMPVFGGLFGKYDEALQSLIGELDVTDFDSQIEVEDFVQGDDTLNDQPISFLSEKREFMPRRIRHIHKNSLNVK